MTDYNLLLRCKDNDPKAYIELFNKYKPLISSMYRFSKRKVGLTLQYEDFMQEVYVLFQRLLIPYCDTTKIKNPQTWLLYKDFYMVILKFINEWEARRRKYRVNFVSMESLYEKDKIDKRMSFSMEDKIHQNFEIDFFLNRLKSSSNSSLYPIAKYVLKTGFKVRDKDIKKKFNLSNAQFDNCMFHIKWAWQNRTKCLKKRVKVV